jgi:hypothetical protein
MDHTNCLQVAIKSIQFNLFFLDFFVKSQGTEQCVTGKKVRTTSDDVGEKSVSEKSKSVGEKGY